MGKFVKGQSGNPGGRPPDHMLRDAARAHTEQAIKTLVAVMTNKQAPAASQVAAACALLDRGYGRPSQSFEIPGDTANAMLGSLQVMFVNTERMIDQPAEEKLLTR